MRPKPQASTEDRLIRLILVLSIAIFVVATHSGRGHGQTSWCGAAGCRWVPPDGKEAKETYDRRERFEKKWGKNTDNYSDQTLKRIEKDPTDPDCWQYTPKHC